MPQVDLEINRNVRRVMVRHWVDLGRLRLSSANGRISIRGALLKIPGQGSTDFSTQNVDLIFNELKRIQNVKWVNAELDNWTDANGTWLPVNQKQHDRKASTSDTVQPSSYDLSKDH